MKDVGKLVYETPVNKSVNTIRLIIFITWICTFFYMFFLRPEMDSTFVSSYIMRFLLYIMFVIVGFTSIIKNNPAIRIYVNGFTKISFSAAYLNYWPKPIHIDDIKGYNIEKTSNGTTYCKLSLANGKNYVIYSGRLEKKASKFFNVYILKQIKRNPNT